MFSGFTTVKMSMAMARRFSLGEFGESKQGGVQGTLPFTPSILARAQTRARPGSVRLLLRYKAARVPMMPQFPFTFCSLLAGGPSNISLACLLSSLPVCLHLSHLEKTENCFISHPVLSPHYCQTFSGKTIVASFVWLSAPTSALLFYSLEHLLLPRKQHRTPNNPTHPTPPENDLPATILPNRLPRPRRRRYPNPPTPYSATNQLNPPPPKRQPRLHRPRHNLGPHNPQHQKPHLHHRPRRRRQPRESGPREPAAGAA